MKNPILYQKDHFRRPVSRYDLYLEDDQQAPPAGWCVRCGGEVYQPGNPLCIRCSRRTGR